MYCVWYMHCEILTSAEGLTMKQSCVIYLVNHSQGGWSPGTFWASARTIDTLAISMPGPINQMTRNNNYTHGEYNDGETRLLLQAFN